MNLSHIDALEWAANLSTALCVWLAARQHILTWPVGILGSALFGLLFWQGALYADAGLQLFFIGTSVMGWRQWLAGQRAGWGQAQPDRLALRSVLGYTFIGLLVVGAYGALLQRFTDAFAPFWDSAVLVSSVLAQLLLMRGHRETWPAWLLVNTISVPLYWSRGLHVTAGLYALFWFNAWYGWWHWSRQHKVVAA